MRLEKALRGIEVIDSRVGQKIQEDKLWNGVSTGRVRSITGGISVILDGATRSLTGLRIIDGLHVTVGQRVLVARTEAQDWFVIGAIVPENESAVATGSSDISVHTHVDASEGGQISHASALTGVTADQHHAGFIGLTGDTPSNVDPNGSDRIQLVGGTDISVTEGTNLLTIAYTGTGGAHDITGASHTASGLTVGHVIRATGATTFAWQQLAHDDLGGLGDDDHTQYLLASGARALTGDWDIGDTRKIQGDAIWARDAAGLVLGDDAGSGIFVEDGGQVGIGTVTPGELLEVGGNVALGVYGTLKLIPDTSVNGTARTLRFDYGSSVTTEGFQFYNSNAATNLLFVRADGNIGIGTTGPDTLLHVYSATSFTAAKLETAATDGYARMALVNDAITWNVGVRGDLNDGLGFENNYSGWSHKMVIKNTGEVGIGVTNPSVMLDVAGAINTTGNVDVGAALDVTGAATFGNDLTVGTNVFFVDYSQSNIGINCAPDAQFDLDINGNLRAQGWIVGKHAIQLADAVMICHFDGPEPYETDFTGVLHGHMGQTPVVTGGVIHRPGKFGKGAQVADATTNYVKNPVFFYNTTDDWGTTGSASSQRVAGGIYNGYYAEVTSTTGAGYFYTATGITPGDAEDVTASFWYRTSDVVTIRLFDYGTSGNLDSMNTADTGGEWVYATLSGTTPTGSGQVRLLFYPADGEAIDVDAVQIENLAYATPLCHGSLGDGHTWSGATHNSTSSRTATKVDFGAYAETFDKSQFSFGCWFTVFDTPSTAGTSANWMELCDGGAERVVGYIDSAVDKFALHVSGTQVCLAGSGSLSRGDEIFVVCTLDFDANSWKVYAYENGTLYTDSDTTAKTTPTDWDTWTIGGNYLGTDPLNEVIDEFFLVERILTADEIQAIFESNAPVFAETSTWMWRSANNLIWADDEGLWGRDADGNAGLAWSGVDGKSWGGRTLDAGDFLLGREASGVSWLLWDQSLGDLTLGIGSVGQVTLDASAGQVLVGSVSGGEYVSIDGTNGIRMYGAGLECANLTTSGILSLGYIAGGEYTTIDGSNGIRMYGGGGLRAQITNTGTFWIGESATSERMTWDTTYGLRIMDHAGSEVMRFDPSGNASITGKLRMPLTTSAIAIGSTPPTSSSAGTGIWLDRTGMYGLLSGTKQFYVDATTGEALAAAGKVGLDSGGAWVRATTTVIDFQSDQAFTIRNAGDAVLGGLAAYDATTPNDAIGLILRANSITSHESYIHNLVYPSSGNKGEWETTVYEDGGTLSQATILLTYGSSDPTLSITGIGCDVDVTMDGFLNGSVMRGGFYKRSGTQSISESAWTSVSLNSVGYHTTGTECSGGAVYARQDGYFVAVAGWTFAAGTSGFRRARLRFRDVSGATYYYSSNDTRGAGYSSYYSGGSMVWGPVYMQSGDYVHLQVWQTGHSGGLNIVGCSASEDHTYLALYRVV
jgi:hypothetical protein